MNTETIHPNGRETQPLTLPRSKWLDQAGFSIYQAVKPAGGLEWHELTPGQRLAYRGAAERAVDGLVRYAELQTRIAKDEADEANCSAKVPA